MKKALLILLVTILGTGCLPRNAFAPPTETYKRWSKPNADDLTIWKDMLECGYAAPFDDLAGIDGSGWDFDQTVASMICMERSGYSYQERGKRIEVCRRYRGNTSCQANAAIPLPDVSRRLSSGYCKKYPESRACVP